MQQVWQLWLCGCCLLISIVLVDTVKISPTQDLQKMQKIESGPDSMRHEEPRPSRLFSGSAASTIVYSDAAAENSDGRSSTSDN